MTDRGYRLRGDESARAGVRRAAHGRVDDALEHLRGDSETDVAEAVHETRKDIKKLRSLLRLVRADLGKQRYRAENARYRDAAQLLSGARDAEVKLETLADVRGRYPDEAPAAERFRHVLERERDQVAGNGQRSDLDRRLEQAAEAIEAGGAEIERWELESDGFELLRSDLKRSYRRGRKDLAALRANPSDEAVHDWRKRVKDLWYQLRLLRDVWPAPLKAIADEADQLGDMLGDHHDLTVLIEDASTRAPGDPDVQAVVELARRRQRELLDAALPLGGRLYAEKPKRFAKRLAAYWQAWRPRDGS